MGTRSSWPGTLSTNKKRIIQELVHGQECATQLQILFQQPFEEGWRTSAEELAQKILRSFDQTLSALSSFDSAEVSQNQTTSNVDNSPCCDDRRSEDSSESRKRPASRDKRGCYKRKRAAHSWTVVSATTEDGHAWRKYGQKDILNSKHPRSYFRCTRKYDQGCRAIKQVQRMEDDPQMYQTTYIGTHTCRDSFNALQIIAYSESWESYKDSKIPSKQQHHHHHHWNPSTTPSVKQESREEATAPSDLTDLDSVIWKDIIGVGGGFDYSSEPGVGSDYGDCRDFEYEFVINKPVEFEDDFHFDESV